MCRFYNFVLTASIQFLCSRSCKTSICATCVCVLGSVSALHQAGCGGRGERGGGWLPHGRAATERRPRGLQDTLLAPRRLHRHRGGLLRLHAAVQEMHHRVSGDRPQIRSCVFFIITHKNTSALCMEQTQIKKRN